MFFIDIAVPRDVDSPHEPGRGMLRLRHRRPAAGSPPPPRATQPRVRRRRDHRLPRGRSLPPAPAVARRRTRHRRPATVRRSVRQAELARINSRLAATGAALTPANSPPSKPSPAPSPPSSSTPANRPRKKPEESYRRVPHSSRSYRDGWVIRAAREPLSPYWTPVHPPRYHGPR